MADENENPAEPSWFVWIPCPALTCDAARFETGGLGFLRVSPEGWRLLESQWVRDMYIDLYRARPRLFARLPAGEDANAAFDSARPVFDRFVTAARLLAEGTWIESHRLALVHTDGQRLARSTGPFRNRHYTAVFGEPLQLPGKMRELGDRKDVRIPATMRPLALAYRMTEQLAREIPRWQDRIAALDKLPATLGLRVALRSFNRGQDVFLGQSQRLLALLAAMEAVFGSYARPGTPRGLGERMARTYMLAGGKDFDVAPWVEGDLRAVRNSMAHGSDHRRELDYKQAEADLQALLRLGLRQAINWHLGLTIDGGDDPALRAPDETARTLHGYQEFLGKQ